MAYTCRWNPGADKGLGPGTSEVGGAGKRLDPGAAPACPAPVCGGAWPCVSAVWPRPASPRTFSRRAVSIPLQPGVPGLREATLSGAEGLHTYTHSPSHTHSHTHLHELIHIHTHTHLHARTHTSAQMHSYRHALAYCLTYSYTLKLTHTGVSLEVFVQ